MTAASGSVLGFILNALIAYTIVDVDAVLDSELVRMTFMSPSITIPPTHSYHLLTQLCDAFFLSFFQGQPFAAYLQQILPQNAALAVLAMTIVCAFSMGQGCSKQALSLSLSSINVLPSALPNYLFPYLHKC